jgi:hypothetical protein
MTTIHETSNTIQFDTALRQMAAKARTRYAGEAARIDRGLVLALNGGVTLHEGGSASVQSSSNAEVVYTVNGHCDCPDASRAPEGRCKHRWSKALVKKASGLARRYFATYSAPDGTDHQGIATETPLGWHFVPEDGGEPIYASTHALVLGGNVKVATAKRAEEEAAGGLVAAVCRGYAR